MRYSRIAALYTAAVAPTLPWLVVLDLRCLWIRPTGNCSNKTRRVLAQTNKWLSGLTVRDSHQLGNLCDVWLSTLACVSTVEEMNEFQWTNLQSGSLRARNSFRLGLPGVFTCLTTSLEKRRKCSVYSHKIQYSCEVTMTTSGQFYRPLSSLWPHYCFLNPTNNGNSASPLSYYNS